MAPGGVETSVFQKDFSFDTPGMRIFKLILLLTIHYLPLENPQTFLILLLKVCANSTHLMIAKVPLGLTSEQTRESQLAFFDIFYHRFKVNCAKSPVFRDRLLNAICKQQIDVLYIIFPILTALVSWVWINRQDVGQNASYSAPQALERTTCLVHTNCRPRLFAKMSMK